MQEAGPFDRTHRERRSECETDLQQRTFPSAHSENRRVPAEQAVRRGDEGQKRIGGTIPFQPGRLLLPSDRPVDEHPAQTFKHSPFRFQHSS